MSGHWVALFSPTRGGRVGNRLVPFWYYVNTLLVFHCSMRDIGVQISSDIDSAGL